MLSDRGSTPLTSTISIHNTVKGQDDFDGVAVKDNFVNILFNELFTLRDILTGDMILINAQNSFNTYPTCFF